MNSQTKDSIQKLEHIESRLKLANEAVELIHEFEEIVSEIGISIMREVSINEEKLTIKVYRSIIDGCGPCGGIFEEEIDFRIDDIEDDYKNKSKEEFLNYVGHLYYAKYRCIEIYDRLQDIEDEA